jgi:gamma-glutamyl-gamma-aminobutyrate hydrolase PuuD
VQWHAETLMDSPPHEALFEELVSVAASERRRLRAA